MRYKEIHETRSASLGLYDPNNDHSKRSITGNRKPFITLRHLNRLKLIRCKNKRDRDAKMNLISTMYGDPQIRENEIEAQQQALENLKDEIAIEIKSAKISQKDRDHISSMALNAVKKKTA